LGKGTIVFSASAFGPSKARLMHTKPRASCVICLLSLNTQSTLPGGEKPEVKGEPGYRHLDRQGGDPQGLGCRRGAVLVRGRRTSVRRVHTDRISAFCCPFFYSISAEYCLLDKASENRAFRLLPIVQPLLDTPVFPKPGNFLLHLPIQVLVIHGQTAWTSGNSLSG